MTNPVRPPLSTAEKIQEATAAMKVFREETLPRIAVAEMSTRGMRKWRASWNQGRL